MKNQNLNKKQKNFCYHFVETGNPYEALSISKMKNENISKLMMNDSIRDEIKKIYEYKKQNLSMKAFIGYERLAFGEILDCIKLMFIKDINDNQLNDMNLFNVSEIKRFKDGTIEIKFFDRMKALEKLEQIESKKSNNETLPFYSALENGIRNLVTKNKDED